MPEISALMSVYNGEEYVAETIESILAQTYADFEFIIVNDGSTDGTKEIIESFKDRRIKLFNLKKNQGIGLALNFGLSKVKGRFIAKVDADDISLPTRFEEEREYLLQNPEIDLVGSFMEYFPHNDEVKTSQRYKYYKNVIEKELNSVVTWQDMRKKLYWFCALNHPNMMGKTEVIKKVGYIDASVGEDYHLFYNLNKLGHKMANIPKVLVKMRVTAGSSTAINKNQFFRDVLYRIKREEIRNLFIGNKLNYIWGSGVMGQELLYALTNDGLFKKITGFIDSDPSKTGKIVMDKTIYSPKILEELKEGQKGKVIIASQPGKYEIAAYLENMDYKHLEDYLVYY